MIKTTILLKADENKEIFFIVSDGVKGNSSMLERYRDKKLLQEVPE